MESLMQAKSLMPQEKYPEGVIRRRRYYPEDSLTKGDFEHTLQNVAWRVDCGWVKTEPSRRHWVGFQSSDPRSQAFYGWINTHLKIDGKRTLRTRKGRKVQYQYKVRRKEDAITLLEAIKSFCNRKKRIEVAIGLCKAANAKK
jgi:hypothetical protein